ncbi:hypothetical protein [Streptomyces venezuelae]|uniref:hypothetical protein n=1 Tax=Streptomyces venezuelae TaxID=54571 RepID=UPI00343300F8
MTRRTQHQSVSWTHTLAILRGAAEGDDGKYLGSLMGIRLHARPLLAARLIAEIAEDEEEDNDCLHRVTDAGRAFHTAHLAALPPNTRCRANYWALMPEMNTALTAIATECECRTRGADA